MDEIRSLDSARGALLSGSPRQALDTLERYEQRYPKGRFVPEVMVLRIQSLSAMGNTQAARALGQRFLSEYPRNPLAERVAQLIGR
jgi:outer membrane protein assembly factor BamD (BamD/ComL family)